MSLGKMYAIRAHAERGQRFAEVAVIDSAIKLHKLGHTVKAADVIARSGLSGGTTSTFPTDFGQFPRHFSSHSVYRNLKVSPEAKVLGMGFFTKSGR